MNLGREKWILLVTLTIIWGSSFILIKKGLEHYNPYQVGALRVLIVCVLLFPLAIINVKKFPIPKLKWLIIAALSGNFIPMFLFPIAETQISSSIAGIVNSMMPIFVILVGALFWNFKTTRRQLLGVAISFIGACIIMLSNHDGGGIKILPIILLLLATLLYAVSVTTVKAQLNDIPAKVLSGFVFSFVLLLPSFIALVLTNFFTEFTGSKEEFIGLGYISLLSIFGTGLAMLLHYRLLKISNPLFASTVTLLMPIVAVIWGVIAGEELTAMQLCGGFIILGGLIFLRAKKP